MIKNFYWKFELVRSMVPTPLSDNVDAVTLRALRLMMRRARISYVLRKQTEEPMFGVIKHVMKSRQLLLRGMGKLRYE